MTLISVNKSEEWIQSVAHLYFPSYFERELPHPLSRAPQRTEPNTCNRSHLHIQLVNPRWVSSCAGAREREREEGVAVVVSLLGWRGIDGGRREAALVPGIIGEAVFCVSACSEQGNGEGDKAKAKEDGSPLPPRCWATSPTHAHSFPRPTTDCAALMKF